ncbi:phage tail terminator protein [Clostridium felsineum]|uniref:phage tail terminator protein n=1 Tax=Clostridium felsineum TaxID=36839 RepID=UPI00098C5F56|nr:minor capsid protein [Clostridium felsineum]URZ16861.1 hypothetical protein CLFE_029080 [Clostridium felsineum DSM 794]
MKLIDLVEFLKAELNTPVYPLQFPTDITDETAVVVDMKNGSFTSSIQTVNFQIMYRSNHPSTAEERANLDMDKLHNLTQKSVNGIEIILVQCSDPVAFFNGQDIDAYYIYTVDYTIKIRK